MNHIMSDRQLSEDQKEIIECGIDAGMKDDELTLLANKELSCDQIMQGYYGIMVRTISRGSCYISET